MNTLASPAPFLTLFLEKSHGLVTVIKGTYSEEYQKVLGSMVMSGSGESTSTNKSTTERTRLEVPSYTGDPHKGEYDPDVDVRYDSDPDSESDTD